VTTKAAPDCYGDAMQPAPSPARPYKLYLVASLGGLAFALAAPPSGWPWLAWLGFAPIWWALRQPMTPRQAAFIAWAGGFPAVLVGFRWIIYTVREFANFGWPLAIFVHVLFSAWHTVPFALWGLGIRLFPQRTLAASVVWACASWVFLSTSWLHIFPHTVVIGFARSPAWMQAAELGGPSLVELEVLVAGILAVEALRAQGSARIRWGAIALGIPVLSYFGGLARIASIARADAQAPTLRVGLVQPNAPLQWRAPRKKLERLHAMSVEAERQGAELIVWPEAGMYPHRLPRELTQDPPDPRYRILRDHSVPTILGVATRSERGESFNSAILVDRDHQFRGHFDKVHLVPFGEHVPVIDPTWLLERIPAMSHLSAGAGPARFLLEHGNDRQLALGPLICYEDIIPTFGRQVATQDEGIDIFVNVTIDTWFGPVGQAEHLALAQFRSVEHRIPMLRSVSSGISAVIGPTGEVLASLPSREVTPADPGSPEVLVFDVPLPRRTSERPTPYARFGWWLVPLSIVLTLGIAVAQRVGARKTA